MSEMIQLRHVPDALHRAATLVARDERLAAAPGHAAAIEQL